MSLPLRYDPYDYLFLPPTAHMAMYANRRRPSVSWDNNPTYIRIESRDDSPCTPATPQQALAHNLPQQLPRSVARLHSADPRAYQQQSSQVPGVLPVPGQYAHPAGSVYAPFHAQFLAGTAPPHAEAIAHYAAGYGGTGDPAGAEDRSGGAGYGYPSSAAAPTPSAPLMTNASLPSTPSETPRTQSPAAPPAAPLPGEPRASSEGSWGTPSPEPEEKKKKGSRSGLSPYLAEFKLKWDIRDARFESLPRQRWFQDQAFSPGRKTCTVVVQEETEPHIVEVPRRADGRTLTVADVVAALDEWLWEKVGKDAFDEHPRRGDVEDERSYRFLGATDGMDGMFRNVDLFRDDSSYFLGLDEEIVGKNNTSTLFVRAGPAPLA